MIRLSARGQVQYQLLSLLTFLLVISSASVLLGALYQLPENPLARYMAEAAVLRFAARSLALTLATGLAAAGIALASDAYSGCFSERTLGVFLRAWVALVIASLLASPIAPSHLLDALSAAGLLALLTWTLVRQQRKSPASARKLPIRGIVIFAHSPFLRVWQIGILLVCLSLLAEPFARADWDRALELFRGHVAYSIAALSVAFWLMTRFSAVERDWAGDGVQIVAGLIFFAGSLISLAPLGLPLWISYSAAVLVVLCYTILGGHVYRALGMRKQDRSLAPHWLAVAALFWLVAGGFLGALSLPAGHNQAMQNTALAAAGDWLMSWALLAVICAFINSVATELRGGNRRVTGYVPLWLVAFGAALSTILQGCRGVVEIYLRDHFALDRAAALALTAPLTQVWLVCMLAVAAGILCFALGFWARLPQIQVERSA